MSERLPCGGRAYPDPSSGLGYRRADCFAVVGSMGQPKRCRELMEQEADQLDADRARNGDPEGAKND